MLSELLVGRVSRGIVVRVVGRGTMQESIAVRAVADANQTAPIVVFDASECEYLDSTFLGCLIAIHKSCEKTARRQFLIVADAEKQMKLFATSSLDRFFDFVDRCPVLVSELTALDVEKPDRTNLCWHVVDCHERLAERGGVDAANFRSVAERLREDLGGRPPESASES